MKRSLSTLATTLLLLAAIVPQATAQIQTDVTEGLSTPSATGPATAPTPAAKANGGSQPANQLAPVTASNPEQARTSVDPPYPAYCPFLPAGVKPGDWEYRESLEKCLHGV